VADKVIALADNPSAPRLTQAELVLIGVTGVDSAVKLALVIDLLVADATAQATVAEIQTYATAVGKVLTNAALAAADTLNDTNSLTSADLVAVGLYSECRLGGQ